MADIGNDQTSNQLLAGDQTSNNTHSNSASQQQQQSHHHHHHQQQQNQTSGPNQLHQSQMTQAHQQAQQQHHHHQLQHQQPNLPSEMANGQVALGVRLLMQGKEAGSIIGKKGDNIRRFRETSGAKINVSDSSCPDRIVTLAGTLDEVHNALSMICYKLEEQSMKVGGISNNSNHNNNNNNTLNANNNNVMNNIPGGQSFKQEPNDFNDDPTSNAASVIDPLFGTLPTGIALKDVVTAAASMNQAVKVEDMLFLNNNSTSTINNNNITTPSKNHTTSPTSNYNNNNESSNSIDGVLHPMVTLRIIIPASQCGSLIGRGGTKIKEIREMTSAAIQVAPDVLPNSTERVVTIIGNVESIRKCAYKICLIILESPPKGYTVPYRPKPALTPMLLAAAASAGPAAYNIPAHLAHLSAHPDVNRGLFVGNNPLTAATFNPNLRAAAAASGQIASALSAVANQSVSSHEMVIPNGLIGCVIGKGGSKINEIRQLSGATIKISNSEEGTKNRTITISGTPEAINLAQYLITARLVNNIQI